MHNYAATSHILDSRSHTCAYRLIAFSAWDALIQKSAACSGCPRPSKYCASRTASSSACRGFNKRQKVDFTQRCELHRTIRVFATLYGCLAVFCKDASASMLTALVRAWCAIQHALPLCCLQPAAQIFPAALLLLPDQRLDPVVQPATRTQRQVARHLQ